MWTKEKVLEESSKLTTMKEWRKNKALSSAADRFGIRAEATKHIPRDVKQYKKDITKQEIVEIASLCSNRQEFQKEHPSLYKKLTKEDLLVIFGSPYEVSKVHSDEFLLTEAKKFNSRNSLKTSNPNVYNTIRKRRLAKQAFEHMGKPKCLPYTFEELRKEALKYTTKQTFKLNSYGHYQAACRHRDFKEICSHMVPGKIATNYDTPMWLYIVKIITLDNTLPIVYKVGITKRPYILDRFWIDYRKNKTRIEVLAKSKFTKGIDAYNLEQEFKLEFSEFKYTGVSPLINTKTSEMFTVNITSRPIGLGIRNCHPNGEPIE